MFRAEGKEVILHLQGPQPKLRLHSGVPLKEKVAITPWVGAHVGTRGLDIDDVGVSCRRCSRSPLGFHVLAMLSPGRREVQSPQTSRGVPNIATTMI